jgi:hypothetical protein
MRISFGQKSDIAAEWKLDDFVTEVPREPVFLRFTEERNSIEAVNPIAPTRAPLEILHR